MEVHFSNDLQTKLARLAAQQGRDTSSLVVEAVERMVDYDEWFRGKSKKASRQQTGASSSSMTKSVSLWIAGIAADDSLDGTCIRLVQGRWDTQRCASRFVGIPPFANNAKDGAPADLLHCRTGTLSPAVNYSALVRNADQASLQAATVRAQTRHTLADIYIDP
jgi:hypothetical protein